MSDERCIVQRQVKPGEPYLFVRADHPLARKMIEHWAALHVVEDLPVDERAAAGKLLEDFKEWKP